MLRCPPAVSASNQRKPSFSSAEVASSVAVGPIPDCSTNLFMRAGQPCYTFLYAPAVSFRVLCYRADARLDLSLLDLSYTVA